MTRANFQVHYATQWGDELFIELRLSAENPEASRTLSLPMRHAGQDVWSLALDWGGASGPIDYRYLFRSGTGEWRREPAFRQVRIAGSLTTVVDQWFAAELPDAAFLRQAFAGVIFRPPSSQPPQAPSEKTGVIRFTLRAPRVVPGCLVCVLGNQAVLGHWDLARARIMSGEHYPLWETELPLEELMPPVEFKFGLWDARSGRCTGLEEGANRQIKELPREPDTIIVNCEHFRQTPLWKGAGVSIPVFSLRSARGYGIGEFADLKPFAEWAADCGMQLVQLLPVNDTSTDFTWKDSYPYKAISTAALHPIYLHIDDLFREYQQALPKDYQAKREALNGLAQVDYETVLKDKLAYLRQLYAVVGAATLSSDGFQFFWREQGDWLRPYLAFCFLRDQQGTADFSRWGAHAVYAEAKIRSWFTPGAAEYGKVMFHGFVQYHLKRQFDAALEAGHARGVAFKGDLPIGIDRCSVEAWTEPELLHMDRQTGAPPDFFAKLGQNWGFPTYHWPRMEADGYAWWRRRLQRMSACFDALRIDHILGFFRIWEIPEEYGEGIMGHFNPALPFSREELRQAGFGRDPEKFAVASATDKSLAKIFGDDLINIAHAMVFRDADGFYRFRPEYVRKDARQAWLAAHGTAAESRRAAEGMQRLSHEVLFLQDPDQPDRFHPRIGLSETAIYEALDAQEQSVLQRLHDDFFHRRHTRFWEAEAMKKLPALMDATRMLICGEDLGMIPDAVPAVLKRLGLLSLELQSMPKQLGRRFGNPKEYPYLSVCTTSTHDLPTVRGQWEEDEAARRAYWQEIMHRTGEAPGEGTPEICRFIVEQHLAAASMWCILPLQDWLGLDSPLRRPQAADERINVPAIPRHYWRYRMHLTLEELQHATRFNRIVRQLLEDTGRSPAV